ncbi:MAG: DNA polymerase III subunit gamma/tau [Patescibacteria group bacterium]|nr:DNA polymerase III subunit gamma/tau [Patescibacteria group bacterium]
MADDSSKSALSKPLAADEYVVIARRYRPQRFDELLGQQHVASALSNAIQTGRVGHAYLFTGARGVGKTSAARILAKSLNCVTGPTPAPCNQCDMCVGIAGGEDVDVLEVDGASNRGIDEIRELRQNVNIRPSRSRFKIYIIDEVHMLTREAFNALLKTLEEPPEHVKFIFCTTEPTKIPITILSRCQRFDFAGISREAITDRLRQIVEAEGVAAEQDALDLLARRAAGSMRDSQSLLEQLLAFASDRITADTVHAMLGTAGEEQIVRMLGFLVGRNAAAALGELGAAVDGGVDAALLLEQLLGVFRDVMAAAAGCPPAAFLFVSPSAAPAVTEAAKRMKLLTVLAAMQIVEQALARMRQSTQGRILAELAAVRICCLEELDELPDLIAQLRAGQMPAVAGPAVAGPAIAGPAPMPLGGSYEKKNDEAVNRAAAVSESAHRRSRAELEGGGAVPENPIAAEPVAMNDASAESIWRAALERLSVMSAAQGKLFQSAATEGPGRLVVTFPAEYALAKSFCERPENTAKLEQALNEVTGRVVRVRFVEAGGSVGSASDAANRAPRPSSQQRLREVMENPMVRRVHELFGASPLKVEGPED